MTVRGDGMLSPELQTLDQLLGGDLPLKVVAELYPTPDDFQKGLLGLLSSGDVLLMDGGSELPRWKWREIVGDIAGSQEVRLRITSPGARRIRLTGEDAGLHHCKGTQTLPLLAEKQWRVIIPE